MVPYSTRFRWKFVPKKVGNNEYLVDLILLVKFLPKLRAVRYYLAETPHFPTRCLNLVYIADKHGIYKLKYPLLIKKTSVEVKHYKIETVVLSVSAQAAKLQKTYS